MLNRVAVSVLIRSCLTGAINLVPFAVFNIEYQVMCRIGWELGPEGLEAESWAPCILLCCISDRYKYGSHFRANLDLERFPGRLHIGQYLAFAAGAMFQDRIPANYSRSATLVRIAAKCTFVHRLASYEGRQAWPAVPIRLNAVVLE